jgi:tetratricopeptide (TPR) repeat protein
MDLRGLAALFGKMNRLLADTNPADREAQSLDLFGLSRFLQRRSEPARAFSACSEALRLGLPSDFRPQAHRDLALLAKRRGDHEQAAKLWHELAADESAGVHACTQLAIHYERRAKDFTRALQFARLALTKLRRVTTFSRDHLASARNSRLERTILHRITRLERRIKSNCALPALGPACDVQNGKQQQSSRTI